MAIKRLSNEQQETKADKPWLEEWLQSLKTPKEKKEASQATFAIKRIFRPKSGKGYILETDSFNAWLWNNAPDGKQLKEDLPAITSGGLVLLLQLDGGTKQGYFLGIDPDLDITCKWNENEESTEWVVSDLPPF